MSDVAVAEELKQKKRGAPGAGRKPGVPNKFSRELKEAMFAGAENFRSRERPAASRRPRTTTTLELRMWAASPASSSRP